VTHVDCSRHRAETVLVSEISSAEFRVSSFCTSGGCVEVALSGDVVAVRDRKDPGRLAQVYSATEWREFIAGVKNGEFDL